MRSPGASWRSVRDRYPSSVVGLAVTAPITLLAFRTPRSVDPTGLAGPRLLVAWLHLAVPAARELRRPPSARRWHGRLLGVPYDLRDADAERFRRALWNPAETALLGPTPAGVGWAPNLARLAALLRLQHRPLYGWLDAQPASAWPVAHGVGRSVLRVVVARAARATAERLPAGSRRRRALEVLAPPRLPKQPPDA
jgi:hypothetical protein